MSALDIQIYALIFALILIAIVCLIAYGVSGHRWSKEMREWAKNMERREVLKAELRERLAREAAAIGNKLEKSDE